MPDNSKPITCTTHIGDIGAMRAVLNATDTAYYLHLAEGTGLKLVKLGQIPYRMLDGQCMFLIKEIDAWFDGLPGVRVQEALAHMHEAATSPAPVSTLANRQRHRKEVKHARAG
jgi:hypothetical protein